MKQGDAPVGTELDRLEPAMRLLLRDALRIPSVSGAEGDFTRFMADHLGRQGFRIDLWQATEADLTLSEVEGAAGHPVAACKHLPLAGRPTLVATLPGTGGGRSLLFNAHADVVAAPDPDRWTVPPWSGTEVGGRFYGRGACDVKGPLVSAVWAMLAVRDLGSAGDVSLELVPGEEDCVTLGTLTSVARGHTADACVVLEPTECLPRNASRPGLRFEITCHGRAVHGTVKWLGVDAIAVAERVLTALRTLEQRWNDRTADSLYAIHPIARPVTVDTVRGGTWQGMVCDNCLVAGYLDLLPGDPPTEWQGRLSRELSDLLNSGGGGSTGRHVTVMFPEIYAGHVTDIPSHLCQTAEAVVNDIGPAWAGWAGFNAGCEAGLRANLLGTPTLVWGPGSLAQAHAVDESVSFADVATVARQFVNLARRWAVGNVGPYP